MRSSTTLVLALAAVIAPWSACDCGVPVAEGEGEGEGDGGEGEGDGGEGEGEGDPDDGCPPYQELCSGTCTPVTVDPDHCGDCDTVCSATQVCSGGVCVDAAQGCIGSLEVCARTCVDTDSDNAHCGACDTPCNPGEGCAGGTCVDAVDLDPVPAGFCAGGGPPVVVPGVSGDTCVGDLAQVSFRFGMCSCDQVQASEGTFIDAFDSLSGPYVPGEPGGGLGANGRITTSQIIDVTGTLWSSANEGLSSSGQILADHELRLAGRLATSQAVGVGLDAFVNGTVDANPLTVGGTLFVPVGTDTSDLLGGTPVVEGPVVVPEPCDCEPNELVPVIAIVEAHRNDNDNALVGLDAAVLASPGAPARIDLECGRYFFTEIDTSDAVTIVAHGRVAIFVGGDITGSQAFSFAVQPGAELDVFVAGRINTSQRMSFGSPAFPAVTRVYVGDPQGLGLSSDLDIGGFLYALGRISTSGDKEIFGGIFAGDLQTSGETRVHYDAAVLQAGQTCEPPPGEGEGEGEGDPGGEGEGEGEPDQCTSCRDCGNQACVGGTCGACTTSADCCAPLSCVGGTCILLGG